MFPNEFLHCFSVATLPRGKAHCYLVIQHRVGNFSMSEMADADKQNVEYLIYVVVQSEQKSQKNPRGYQQPTHKEEINIVADYAYR